ncbi:MAG: bifunctional glycosyltransferase family 2/GtrA family protein [Christensenellaceae bacterium]|jgi:glycosyltransferase involved in cell wall biosynthesis|nr:bifunctional glycosyltransferase family 2/GtrA family protein [Christensenellaceae bacterium]
MAVVLIPAYRPAHKEGPRDAAKPSESMQDLLDELFALGGFEAVVIVDDGGGEAYAAEFSQAESKGALVLRHAVNRGKGQALKTGLNFILERFPGQGIVAADCDGQHTPGDILRLCRLLDEGEAALVLGRRVLPKSSPWKSRAGNAVMRASFHLSTGVKVHDTQTGLRAFPAQMLPRLMTIPGDRYEYEMNMLLRLAQEGVLIKEVPIETVYINNNMGSHFNPVRDALRVFSRIFAFMASSLFCYAVDYGLYALLLSSGAHAWLAHGCARAVSSALNFALNRNYVFGDTRQPLPVQILKYGALVLFILGLGVGALAAGEAAHLNAYVLKPALDFLLHFVSFAGQRLLVFSVARKKEEIRG